MSVSAKNAPPRRLGSIVVLSSSYPARPGDYRGRFVHDLSLSLQRLGHEVRVLTPAISQTTCQSGELEVVRFGRGPTGRAPFGSLFGNDGMVANLKRAPVEVRHLLPACLKAGRLLSQVGPGSVIICHWLFPFGIVGALSRRRHKRPVWIVCHSGGVRVLQSLPKPGRQLVAQLLEQGADHLTFVTEELRDEFLDCVGRRACRLAPRCEVLRMGIDRTQWASCQWDPTGPITVVARLTRLKGVDRILRALADTGSKRPLRVVGDGPEGGSLAALADRLGIAVEFMGERETDQIPLLVSGSSLSALTSRQIGARKEGAPVFALEALAAGQPFLTTQTWGIPDEWRESRGIFVAEDNQSSVTSQLGHALAYLASVESGSVERDRDARRRLVASSDWSNLAVRASERIR